MTARAAGRDAGVAAARARGARARAWVARLIAQLAVSRTGANAGWLLLDRLIRQGGNLVLQLLIARHLGVASWGVLSYAAALASFASAVGGAGVDTVVVRNLVRAPDQAGVVLGSALAVRGLASMLACLVVTSVAVVLAPDRDATVLVVALLCTGVLFQAADVADLWFQATGRVRTAAQTRAAVFGCSVAARVGVVALGGGVRAIAAATAVESLVATGALMAAYHRHGGGLRAWRARWTQVGALLRDGWPLCLSALAVLVYMRIDTVMLGAMRGDRDVGLYGAATRLSEAWYLVPTALAAAAAPGTIAAHHAGRREEYEVRVRALLRGLTLLALVVAVALTVWRGPVVTLVFGPAYHGAAAVLAVHVWSGVFVAAGVAQTTWSVCEGLTRLVLVRAVFGAAANVALNLVLIPRYGGVGAAAATLAAQALSAVALNAADPRTRPFFWLQIQALLPDPRWRGRRRAEHA